MWSIGNCAIFENLQSRFLKVLLKVKKSTPITMLYVEISAVKICEDVTYSVNYKLLANDVNSGIGNHKCVIVSLLPDVL